MNKEFKAVSVDDYYAVVDTNNLYLKNDEFILREWYPPTQGFKREIVPYKSGMQSLSELRIVGTIVRGRREWGIPLIEIPDEESNDKEIWEDGFKNGYERFGILNSGYDTDPMWKKSKFYKAAQKGTWSDEDMRSFSEWCSENFRRTYPTQQVYKHTEGDKLWFPQVTWNGKFEARIYHSEEIYTVWKSLQNKRAIKSVVLEMTPTFPNGLIPAIKDELSNIRFVPKITNPETNTITPVSVNY